MTKLREIVRLYCGIGADVCDEDAYWVEFDAVDDPVVTILIAPNTPVPVSSTLLTMAAEVLMGEFASADEDETTDTPSDIIGTTN